MYEVLMIIVIALVTLMTRALPFVCFKNNTNQFITYLGEVLPYSIMPMLVVYCLKSVNFLTGYHGICEILAVLTVIGLHLYKRNTLISIIGGTCVYMICVQMIFI